MLVFSWLQTLGVRWGSADFETVLDGLGQVYRHSDAGGHCFREGFADSNIKLDKFGLPQTISYSD